jgi:hypothetical protein
LTVVAVGLATRGGLNERRARCAPVLFSDELEGGDIVGGLDPRQYVAWPAFYEAVRAPELDWTVSPEPLGVEFGGRIIDRSKLFGAERVISGLMKVNHIPSHSIVSRRAQHAASIAELRQPDLLTMEKIS